MHPAAWSLCDSWASCYVYCHAFLKYAYNLKHVCCLSNVSLYDKNILFKHISSKNSVAFFHIYFFLNKQPMDCEAQVTAQQ